MTFERLLIMNESYCDECGMGFDDIPFRPCLTHQKHYEAEFLKSQQSLIHNKIMNATDFDELKIVLSDYFRYGE